ncbi:MAG: DUF4080 domain-containing protein [Veillonellales bacterium]
MGVLLTTLNAKYIHSSLALRCLQAYCRPVCSQQIMLKEYTINNHLLDVVSDIFRQQPDVLGLACYIWNREAIIDLAAMIRKVLPQTVIILGGPEVSYDSVDCMAKHDFIDYIIQGEGEETLRLLLEALAKGKEVTGIPGLVYRENQQPVKNSGPQVMESLNNIPFPYEEEKLDELKDKILYYESSRGCPFSCQYCLSSASEGVRFTHLAKVYRELAVFVKHNVKQVKFVDRTFNCRKEHYLPILRFLAKQDCRTNFHFEIAADLLDDEVVGFFQDVPAGRFQLEIGVQSTNEGTLAEIHRQNNWPKIVDNVTRILSYGNIHVHLDLIVGLPFETLPQFGKSFNDVYQLKPDMLQIGFLKLLKGCGIRRKAAEHGYVYMDKAPYEVLGNRYMPYKEIRQLKIMEDVFNQYYNSGRFYYVLPFLIRLEQEDAFRFYRSLADFWEQRDLQLAAHNTKSLYHHLWDFCQIKYFLQKTACEEFLRFNALLLIEKTLLGAEFLNWNGDKWSDEKNRFWRNDAVVKKYLPHYLFTTWRNNKKNYHIEVFSGAMGAYLPEKELKGLSLPILFSWDGIQARYQVIAPEDFWLSGRSC